MSSEILYSIIITANKTFETFLSNLASIYIFSLVSKKCINITYNQRTKNEIKKNVN